MSDLYDTDVLLWSEQQAGLLRRRAAGELVNEAELDWPNIAEEIESVGSEQWHAVESLLLQALLHRLKAAAWPLSRDVPHWQSEARLFSGPAAGSCHPCARGSTSPASTTTRSRPCRTGLTISRRCRCRRSARSRWTSCWPRTDAGALACYGRIRQRRHVVWLSASRGMLSSCSCSSSCSFPAGGRGSSRRDLEHHAVVAGLDAGRQVRRQPGPVHVGAHMGQHGAARADPGDPLQHRREVGVGPVRAFAQEAADDPGVDAGQRLEGGLVQRDDVGRIGECADPQPERFDPRRGPARTAAPPCRPPRSCRRR